MAIKPTALTERIKAIRDEIDGLLDARAAELHKTMPGVPASVLRGCLIGRAPCLCAAATALSEKGEL